MNGASPRVLTVQTTAAHAGCTVRSVLRAQLHMADSLLSHLKFVPNAILCDGAPVRLRQTLRGGETLCVTLDETKHGVSVRSAATSLDIRYEDEDIIVLNKPAGIAVHGAPQCERATLADALAAYWGAERPFRPVSRLDRGTSGAMVVAKSRYVHDRLRTMLHTSDFRRTYLAVVVGEGLPARGEVTLPIARSASGGYKRTVDPNGQAAYTSFEALVAGGGCTLLRLTLQTGRTHQIRVHMGALGHPLVGDALYGTADARIARHALHSAGISLVHPVRGASIDVEAPLPQDMAQLCQACGFDIEDILGDCK